MCVSLESVVAPLAASSLASCLTTTSLDTVLYNKGIIFLNFLRAPLVTVATKITHQNFFMHPQLIWIP